MILVLSVNPLTMGAAPHFADIFQAVGQAQQSLPETLVPTCVGEAGTWTPVMPNLPLSDGYREILDSLGPVAENFPAPLSGETTRMRFPEFPRDKVFLEHPGLTEGQEKIAFRFVRTADFWRLLADVVGRVSCFGKCPVPMNTSGFHVLQSILDTRYGQGKRRDGYLGWTIHPDLSPLCFPVGSHSGYRAIRLT